MTNEPFDEILATIMEIVVRDQLDREDMEEFKRKIQAYFPDKLIIRAKTTFIP